MRQPGHRDLHEWSHEDPYWATWAVRTRERVPHLDVLVETAERHMNKQVSLVAATDAASDRRDGGSAS